MPRLDKSGPEGQGPLTGRGLGHCSNLTEKEKIEKLGQGLAIRRQSGGGKGLGKRFRNGNK